jgi:hypothetical protein
VPWPDHDLRKEVFSQLRNVGVVDIAIAQGIDALSISPGWSICIPCFHCGLPSSSR